MENQNLKLILSWNGEKFSGYQYQPHAFTVQEAITNAWKILNKEVVSLCGCSRLDAGVHAQNYVLNFNTTTKLSEERIVKGLNGIFHSNLSLDISVYQAIFTHSDFHSRFHSKGKHYRYLIWYGYSENSFLTKRCWHVRAKLCIDDIKIALQQFIGKHDFAAFRSTDCAARTTIRNIFNIDAWNHPVYPEMLIIDVWGDGFLKNMIRNIVGTSVEVATGKLKENSISESFLHKDRARTGMCAPAWALSLMRVYYEKIEMEDAIQLSARRFVPS
jgi:tRNA pseudouridine38-40 synthase